jgi:chemotaxis protein methyltransferase CheR
LQDLLRTTIANRLDDDKHYLASARLGPVAQANGLADVASLLQRARQGDFAVRDQIIEAMTINETSFFRDLHPFRALADHILPELVAQRTRPLRMWSAAAATGQEAYSLALIMAENFPGHPATILGTDVSETALERAKSGTYSQFEVNRGLPARLLVRHFTQNGRSWEISPQLRRSVRFERLNLSQPWPISPAMDVIMLRNVLIYFDQATRAAVLNRIVATLAPGGYLILGSAENLMMPAEALERVELGRSMCFRARG